MIRVDIALRRGDFRLRAAFEAPDRGVTGLFGPSGSGKTTIVDAVAGLAEPDSGRIAVGERVLFDRDAGVSLPPERRRIGYVFQEARLFPHMDVRANLLYGARRRGRAGADGLDRIADMLDLGRLLRRRTVGLSGGEAQRVAIGRALLSAPDLLLMDEPLSSLDERRKEEVFPYLEHLADGAGVPVLYVTHAIEEMIRLADHVAVVDDGTVTACGPLAEVMARPDVPVLADRRDAGTIVRATVASHSAADRMTDLAFDGRSLAVPLLDRPEGTRVAVRILARDVAIALERPARTSVLNVLEGSVADLHERADGHVDVTIDAGQPVRARITGRSAAALGIAPGMPVFALVKAVSFAHRDLHRSPPAGP